MFKFNENNIIYVKETFIYFFAIHQYISGIVIAIGLLNKFTYAIIFRVIITWIIYILLNLLLSYRSGEVRHVMRIF